MRYLELSRWIRCAALALLTSTAIGLTAVAQNEVHNEVALDEVVVTAHRTPEVKSQSATTVTIVTRKELAELNKTMPDMQAIVGFLVPGMASTGNTTSERSNTLRGRSVLVLIDGIPQTTPLRATSRDLRTIDPTAVERIEVIKGATALYGNGANGGIINIVTRKNSGDKPFGGQSYIAMQDHSLLSNKTQSFGYRLNQQLYGKLGGFDYLVNGVIGQTGSSVDGDGVYLSPRYGLGDTRTYNALAKVGYQLSETARIEGMYNFFRTTQNSPLIASGGKYLESPRIGIKGDQPKEAIPEGMAYNHNAYLRYTHQNIFSGTNFEATLQGRAVKVVTDYRIHNEKKPRWEGTSGQATIEAKQIGAKAQLDSRLPLSEQVFTKLLYGIDFTMDRTGQPLVDGRYWVPEMTALNFGPFVQTKTTIGDLLNIKVGARYDRIDVHVPDYEVLPKKAGVERTKVQGGVLPYNNLSLNGGVTLNRWRVFQPFLAYSQGFSIYDLGRTLRDAKSDVLSKIETSPVKTHNAEVGFYSTIRGLFGEASRLETSGAVFYTYAALGSDLKSVDGFWVVDRSPQRILGGELSMDATINRQWQTGFGFSMMEGKKYVDGSWDHYMGGQSIPPMKITAYINCRPTKYSYIRLYGMYTGARDRFARNEKGKYNEGEGKVSPVTLLHLNAGLTVDKFTYTLGIENLLNTTYYTVQSQLVARDNEYTHGNGRVINLSMTYRF